MASTVYETEISSSGFIFKNVFAANLLFETCPIRDHLFFFPSRGGELMESQMSPKIRNHRRQWRLEEAFHFASSKFKIADLNDYHKLAIRRILVEKDDIFVNLPTESGKSLIYQQNGADWQTRLPRFLAIVDLPFSFRFLDRLFWQVASIAFLKDTSCCGIRRIFKLIKFTYVINMKSPEVKLTG